MLLLFNNENHKSVRDNNDSDGDDEIESNESQVGEVCTGWVLLRHSIVAALDILMVVILTVGSDQGDGDRGDGGGGECCGDDGQDA